MWGGAIRFAIPDGIPFFHFPFPDRLLAFIADRFQLVDLLDFATSSSTGTRFRGTTGTAAIRLFALSQATETEKFPPGTFHFRNANVVAFHFVAFLLFFHDFGSRTAGQNF